MEIEKLIEKLTNIADIVALPFWVLIIYYFVNIVQEKEISNQKTIEWILLLFVISGLIADLVFSAVYIKNNLK